MEENNSYSETTWKNSFYDKWPHMTNLFYKTEEETDSNIEQHFGILQKDFCPSLPRECYDVPEYGSWSTRDISDGDSANDGTPNAIKRSRDSCDSRCHSLLRVFMVLNVIVVITGAIFLSVYLTVLTTHRQHNQTESKEGWQLTQPAKTYFERKFCNVVKALLASAEFPVNRGLAECSADLLFFEDSDDLHIKIQASPSPGHTIQEKFKRALKGQLLEEAVYKVKGTSSVIKTDGNRIVKQYISSITGDRIKNDLGLVPVRIDFRESKDNVTLNGFVKTSETNFTSNESSTKVSFIGNSVQLNVDKQGSVTANGTRAIENSSSTSVFPSSVVTLEDTWPKSTTTAITVTPQFSASSDSSVMPGLLSSELPFDFVSVGHVLSTTERINSTVSMATESLSPTPALVLHSTAISSAEDIVDISQTVTTEVTGTGEITVLNGTFTSNLTSTIITEAIPSISPTIQPTSSTTQQTSPLKISSFEEMSLILDIQPTLSTTQSVSSTSTTSQTISSISMMTSTAKTTHLTDLESERNLSTPLTTVIERQFPLTISNIPIELTPEESTRTSTPPESKTKSTTAVPTSSTSTLIREDKLDTESNSNSVPIRLTVGENTVHVPSPPPIKIPLFTRAESKFFFANPAQRFFGTSGVGSTTANQLKPRPLQAPPTVPQVLKVPPKQFSFSERSLF